MAPYSLLHMKTTFSSHLLFLSIYPRMKYWHCLPSRCATHLKSSLWKKKSQLPESSSTRLGQCLRFLSGCKHTALAGCRAGVRVSTGVCVCVCEKKKERESGNLWKCHHSTRGSFWSFWLLLQSSDLRQEASLAWNKQLLTFWPSVVIFVWACVRECLCACAPSELKFNTQ